MARATILVLDPVLGHAHAEMLRRLDCRAELIDSPEIDSARMPDVVLIGGSAIDAVREVRRSDPNLPLLVALEAQDIDLAGACLGLDHLAFVSAPWGEEAFAVALGLLQVRQRPSNAFAETDAGYALRLAALGEEIARIARAIEPPVSPADAPAVPETPIAFDPKLVRQVLRDRRRRDALFSAGTFADPVWDMLLDLTAARGEGQPVSVSSLAIAAAVPATTALRHLKAMSDAGLVVRRADPGDGRRVHIDLSDDAFARMRAWVAGLGKAV